MANSDISKRKIEEFWTSLEAFAAYCFPKAHSSCYATIAYWTAYLKANFPAAFMAALMTSDYDDTDRLSIEISECKNMGIEVLPPDVQQSFAEFAVIRTENGKDQIRFGLNAIKNVGTGAVEEIIKARGEVKFESLEDFLSKTSVRVINRKTLESLIKAGALDSFNERSILLNNLEGLIAYSSRIQKDKLSGQTDLFGEASTDSTLIPRLNLNTSSEDKTNPRQQLFWERELLGIYLSRHPLADFELILKEQCIPIEELDGGMENQTIKIGGSITDIREITTKAGKKMAFIRLADLTRDIELIVFPSLYEQTIGLCGRDNVVIVKGKLSSKDRSGTSEELKIIVDDVREIRHEDALSYSKTGKKPSKPKSSASKDTKVDSPSLKNTEKRVYIRLDNTEDQRKLMTLKELIDKENGVTPVVLVVGESPTKKIIKLPHSVNPHEKFIEDLSQIFGPHAVKYQ